MPILTDVAAESLPGMYLLYTKNNTRKGAVFYIESIRYDPGCTKLICLPEEEFWPERAGPMPDVQPYSIENLPGQWLHLTEDDKLFRKLPIFDVLDPEQFEDLRPTTTIKRKKTMGINLKTAAALVMEDVTTVATTTIGNGARDSKEYTYLVPREIVEGITEAQVEKGLLILTESSNSNGTALRLVTKIHDQPQIDLNDDTDWKWAFQLVDRSGLGFFKRRTETVYAKLREKQQQQTQKSVLAQLGMEKDDLKALIPPQ